MKPSSPRDLGIPLGRFDPGPTNAITDVTGVSVGHSTIVTDAVSGRWGAIRTGVTCVWPHEAFPWDQPVYAGVDVLNGHGELIGISQIREWGVLLSPVFLTSSLAIGSVYDAAAKWSAGHDEELSLSKFFMPVVTEVSDLTLSDNRAFPLQADHVEEALSARTSSRSDEGGVGAGTGTICYGLKGGIGTASRHISTATGGWTLGALVLTNYGDRDSLTIAGVRVGPLLGVPVPPQREENSCVVVIATDAPLLPHQLTRVARRAGIGITRSGSFVSHSSGDIALAFSTASRLGRGDLAPSAAHTVTVPAVADGPGPVFDRIFEATVEAVHEAVLNSLFAATTTVGRAGNTAHALPVEVVMEVLHDRGIV